jgi:hypothetical protein
MANALGELFGNIAGAIREKTGEVGTMKPAKFPEKIKAISTVKNQDKTITENGTYSADDGYTGLGTVTVEVAGAGGGSVPAGLYRRSVANKPYGGSATCFFKFNNKLYCISQEVYNDTAYHIFVFNNGTWVKRVPNATAGWSAANPGQITAIEHNGKVHIVSEYTKDHSIWDGVSETLEKVSVLHCIKCGLFVYNGELYTHSTSRKVFNKWNEDGTNTTYTFTSNLPAACTPFEYNGELYFFNSTNLYKLNLTGLTTTVVKSGLPNSSSAYYVAKGRYVYVFASSRCRKFDMETLSYVSDYFCYNCDWYEFAEVSGTLYGMMYASSMPYFDEIHEVVEEQ